MNKYIRTGNNIFEVVGENDLVFRVKAKHDQEHTYCKSKCQTDVLKQADLIDDLCDCFVKIKRKRGCKDFILKYDYRDLPSLREQFLKYPGSPVYGAIHVEEKGLIFIAKMTGNGEFELL